MVSEEMLGREPTSPPPDAVRSAEEELDLETLSPAAVGETASKRLAQERAFQVDPVERKREDMRGWIAIALVLILAFVVIAAFATVWTNGGLTAAMKDLLTIILGPVVTLVGSATGFYFGGGRAGRADAKGDG